MLQLVLHCITHSYEWLEHRNAKDLFSLSLSCKLIILDFGADSSVASRTLKHLLHVFPFSLYRSGSIIVDYLIFTSPEYSGTLQDLRNALTGRLNNSRLGVFTVETPVIEGKLIGYVSHAVEQVNKRTGGSHKRGDLADGLCILHCIST